MNYLILKNIVETTIAQFVCKECGSKTSEQNIQILGTAGNALNMEISCPQCQASGIVKAEINIIGANAANMGQIIEQIKKVATEHQSHEPAIRDEDIVKLREGLKNSSSIQDLFNS